jgi:hypothetical protein
LGQLEKLRNGMRPDSKVGWVYNGTLTYLRGQQMQGNARQRLLELVEAAKSTPDAKGMLPAIFEANRLALQAATAH